MSRSGFVASLVSGLLGLTLTGCSDAWNAGPVQYTENEALTAKVKDPGLRDKVRKALTDLFGESPQRIRVPEGSGLTAGGLYLANLAQEGEGTDAKLYSIYEDTDHPSPTKLAMSDIGDARPQAGGYAIYRKNCLHCHGVSGAGDGPTAPFLYPIPRDYRKGIFKFTSTISGKKPARDDLRRTIKNGLHGTSMPAFDALLDPAEIEQVIDYVMFLSMRGEVELVLVEEASIADEKDPNALSADIVKDVANGVFDKWKQASSQVLNPPTPRTATSRESILRGREMFLGRTTEKLECAGCHGALARGDGPSFVSQDVFNDIVFGGNPSERAARVELLDEKTKTLWKQKADEWGNPLRPANLNRGVYKGGRRPLDIFWRIAKGINGAQMPAHYPSPLNEAKVWDLVNFVLALPYDPALLRDVPPAAAVTKVASSAAAR
jgi:mono/diheme cytochrome c family protein